MLQILQHVNAQTNLGEILSMLVHAANLVYTTDEAMQFLPESMRDGQKYAALLDWYRATEEYTSASCISGTG